MLIGCLISLRDVMALARGPCFSTAKNLDVDHTKGVIQVHNTLLRQSR